MPPSWASCASDFAGSRRTAKGCAGEQSTHNSRKANKTMSDWKKMTKEQKAKRNARRRALHAERKAAAAAKAAKAAAKPCKCAKKHPCKACPKKAAPAPEQKKVVQVTADAMSTSEKAALVSVKRATDERNAVEKCVKDVSNALMDLVRTFRPEITKLVIEHKDAPKKDEKAVPAKK